MVGKRRRDDDDDGPGPSGGSEAAPTIGQQTAHIKNKQVRGARYVKLKHEKSKAKKKKRAIVAKEAAKAEELGLPPPEKAVPKTIENTREKDETTVQPEDAEVAADEDQDEFAEHFKRIRPPNVLITTSYKVTGTMYRFISELLEVLPCATYYKRQGYPLKKIVEYAKNRDFTDLMVFNEDRKQINGLLLVHLPDGPTAQFRMSNLVLSADIKNHARATSHRPELVLNNFDTGLGHRVGRMFASLFHQDPTFRGRRVVTFHNQRDFVFFRHHRYIFEEREKKEKGKKDKVAFVKARLQEIGPRFTLKLQSLQKGTFDSKGGEFEWLAKPDQDTSRRKFQLFAGGLGAFHKMARPLVEDVLLSTSCLGHRDILARLWGAPDSLPALLALAPSGSPFKFLMEARDDISAQDVVLSELLNARTPAAWVSAARGEAAALAALARHCQENGLVLAVTNRSNFDLVLLPRAAGLVDGIFFCGFATRVEGVAFIARTIAARQVAVVLDLDSTLLESEHLPVQPADWRDLDWRAAVMGRISALPDEPHHAESVHAASWVWRGCTHSYRVRQRLGWTELREMLAQEGRPGGKLAVFVNSARPDGVSWCPEKTPCIGVGLRSVFEADFNMRLGPLWVADDLPEVFNSKYREMVYQVSAYKPVASRPNDYDADGSVLKGMADHIQKFWRHCYGADGGGGAVAALVAAAQRTMTALCVTPLVPGAAASAPVSGPWPDALFKGHGPLSTALSVQQFLEERQLASLLAAAAEAEQAVPAARFVSDTEEVAAVEDAAPAVPAVAENDENAVQAVAGKAHPAVAAHPVPPERVLRPSSRQDGPASPATSHLLVKPAGHQHAPWPVAAPEPPAEAGQQPPATASTAALAEEESDADADGGSGQLVRLLESQGGLDEPAVEEAAQDGCCCGYGAPLPAALGCAAAAAASPRDSLGGLDACPVEIVGSEVEDAEVEIELAAVEAGEPAAEAGEESGAAGRKRDFSAILANDSLLGPGAFSAAITAAQAEYLASHPDKTIKTILLLVAMEAEATPMVEALGLAADSPPRIPPPAPCHSFSGQHAGAEVHLVCFGKCKATGVDNVGTVPAALTTYLAIQAFKPDVVISTGTAGGFRSRGAAIADVFVSTGMVNHDRRIPIPGFDKYGVGAFDALPTPQLQKALGLKAGVVTSGNSLDYTAEDMARMVQHEAAVKEMEAAAVAWAADLFGCPMFCIKSITDIVDGDRPAQDEFLENLHKSADALQRAAAAAGFGARRALRGSVAAIPAAPRRCRPAQRPVAPRCTASVDVHELVRRAGAAISGSNGASNGASGAGTVAMPRKGAGVTFRARRKLKYGYVLKLVGSGVPLGNWDTERAPSMRWTEGDRWVLTVDLPAGSYDFKPCVVRGHDHSNIVRWDDGSNRTLEVTAEDAASGTSFFIDFDNERQEVLGPPRAGAPGPAGAPSMPGTTPGFAPWGRPLNGPPGSYEGASGSVGNTDSFESRLPRDSSVDDLRAELERQRAARQAAEAERDELRRQVASDAAEAAALVSNSTSMRLEFSAIADELASAEEGRLAAAEAAEAIAAQLDELAARLQAAEDARAALQAERDEMDHTLSWEQQRCAQLESERDSMAAEVRAAKAERDELLAEKNSRPQELGAALAQAEAAAAERNALAAQLAQVQSELEAALVEQQRLAAVAERAGQHTAVMRSVGLLLSSIE
ncbi:Ribosome production factor 1 isoform A [Micractinium conductrix]|uniref:Ribosome production factor 1 isoform A n=1 Tax=Micractinium conductrix TaxID=554055 RepID=A0A2P6VBC8_9CHLO|nr:Ribosome production factor 1 isoform A [Micractinium conductrix]|eukprot:PSC71393.1 Ribosome production factor 1 isoform A [Micractinium conductrix]